MPILLMEDRITRSAIRYKLCAAAAAALISVFASSGIAEERRPIQGGSLLDKPTFGEKFAVDECARAAEKRVNSAYRAGGSARVVEISGVERKSNGVRVRGAISSATLSGFGAGDVSGYQGGGTKAYGPTKQVADLMFTCEVDVRGSVTDIDIKPRN